MRVCLVTPFCEAGEGGGIATHVRAVAAALGRRDFEVIVVSGRRGRAPEPIEGARLELVEGPADTFDPGFWKASRAAFDRLSAEGRFDVVLSEGSCGWGLLGAGPPVVGLAHQFKVVHLVNSFLEVDGPRTLGGYLLATVPRALKDAVGQERPFFRACRLVVSGAEHMARRLRSAYSLRDVRVAPNWLDAAGWRPEPEVRSAGRRRFGLGEGEFAFLVLGRLQKTKGFMDAVRAFRTSFPGDARARLLVAGPGASEELRRAAAEDPRVRAVGEIADSSLREAYQAADAFVMPSRLHEVLSYSLLQAMASGLACVAADRPGNREALGEQGLYFASGDAGKLGESLKRLRGDADLRTRLGRAARARLEEKFSEEACAPRLVEAVLEAAGSSA